MANKFTDEDDALLGELGVEVEAEKKTDRTAREERVIAGFEEIQRFVDREGHAPRHGEGLDIFERIYAVRLDRLRELPDCRAMLEPLDRQGLLMGATPTVAPAPDDLDDDALLAELGVEVGKDDISALKHVRSAADKRAAEEIANRTKCEEFDQFKPLFAQVRKDIEAGVRETRPFQTMAEIQKGEFFIVGGQVAYVADVGKEFVSQYDRRDSRLRVIYDTARKAMFYCVRCNGRCTATTPGGVSPTRLPGRCSLETAKRAIWRPARSMCCAANPKTPRSPPIAMFCTRSASPAARSKRA